MAEAIDAVLATRRPSERGAEISLLDLLRSMNSMSSDGVRQLHERLAILHMVDEANRWRLKESTRFDVTKRILIAAGVQGLD